MTLCSHQSWRTATLSSPTWSGYFCTNRQGSTTFRANARGNNFADQLDLWRRYGNVDGDWVQLWGLRSWGAGLSIVFGILVSNDAALNLVLESDSEPHNNHLAHKRLQWRLQGLLWGLCDTWHSDSNNSSLTTWMPATKLQAVDGDEVVGLIAWLRGWTSIGLGDPESV